MILIAWTFAFVGLLAIVTLKVAGPAGLQVQTNDKGTSVTFKSENKQVSFDTVLVHPLGWVGTTFEVKKGDSVTLTVSGRVNVAMGRMIDSLELVSKTKLENQETIHHRELEYFTQQQIERATFAYPWCGAAGVHESELRNGAKESAAATRKQRVDEDARVGQLIAIIAPTNKCPDRGKIPSGVQHVAYDGEDSAFTVEKAGKLCFVVNDITYENDDIDELAWQDNLGFYLVRIKITSAAERGEAE